MSTGHPENYPGLVIDIGGTHIRLARISAPGAACEQLAVYHCADFPDLESAIARYLAEQPGPQPRSAAIATANPVTGDLVKLTNQDWCFSIAATRERLGLKRLMVVNDFTGLALALPHLGPGELRQVGGGEPVPGAAKALLGPGTGLGVSGLVPTPDGHWAPLAGEGGHVSFAPADARELEILRLLWRQHPHVSAERLISGGMGLQNLYATLAELNGVAAEPLDPVSIVARGVDGSDALCGEVLDTLCAMLGSVAGDLALTLGARGGVYIGGGIVPRLGARFDRSAFRTRFEAKGRFRDYLATIPCYVITAATPTLLGVADLLE
ncbi:MAG TPA: glucokinase [Candidatus Competibacteraceae bacterium]|nr:glucokinase [Candidatus Competibacteraceae bacterium]